MIVLLVRFVGIVACFFTSWQLGLAALLPVILIHYNPVYQGVGFRFDSPVPRYIAEVVTLAIGLYGIWIFPHVPRETARIIAVVAGLAIMAELAHLFNKRRIRRSW